MVAGRSPGCNVSHQCFSAGGELSSMRPRLLSGRVFVRGPVRCYALLNCTIGADLLATSKRSAVEEVLHQLVPVFPGSFTNAHFDVYAACLPLGCYRSKLYGGRDKRLMRLIDALHHLDLDAEILMDGRWARLEGKCCCVSVVEMSRHYGFFTWCDNPAERSVEYYPDALDAILSGLRRAESEAGGDACVARRRTYDNGLASRE